MRRRARSRVVERPSCAKAESSFPLIVWTLDSYATSHELSPSSSFPRFRFEPSTLTCLSVLTLRRPISLSQTGNAGACAVGHRRRTIATRLRHAVAVLGTTVQVRTGRVRVRLRRRLQLLGAARGRGASTRLRRGRCAVGGAGSEEITLLSQATAARRKRTRSSSTAVTRIDVFVSTSRQRGRRLLTSRVSVAHGLLRRIAALRHDRAVRVASAVGSAEATCRYW